MTCLTSYSLINMSMSLNTFKQVKREFGSFDKYIWGFVNHKPISTQFKSGQKIPVKTSKSESISKDMVRRGFRFVGPTVVHSFMQASGLTNDHLITCHRHLQCTLLAARRPTATSATTNATDAEPTTLVQEEKSINYHLE